ncbi:STAS domain-containing protein [Antrihabitans sp. YC2-6]|uniref:STAS domain-containing protein n=1 Tax=Antrihabitans sp. YC2-6 TaxID=2799498 RepID=UPI001F47D506|nr:STAS domain-containing protein [Antrihabitans sp. YC2-6]
MSTDPADQLRSPDTLTTALSEQSDLTVLTVSGTIDLATAATLRDAVDVAIGKARTGLIIDLSGVDFLASAGMTILVDARQRVADKAFAVVADGPATARPLKLTGLDEALSLYATLVEAVERIG